MRTVAFCEIDPFCRRVLAKHWPNVPCYENVRELRGESIAADVVCGGFPCQPASTLGKRLGKEDDRWLWPEMLRVISECQPTWVIGENVDELDGMALDDCLDDLEAIGYETAPPLEIPACAVGANQWRNRVWILAYSNKKPKGARGNTRLQDSKEIDWPRLVLPRRSGMADGIPDWVDRVGACGNAVVPQIPEIIGKAIITIVED